MIYIWASQWSLNKNAIAYGQTSSILTCYHFLALFFHHFFLQKDHFPILIQIRLELYFAFIPIAIKYLLHNLHMTSQHNCCVCVKLSSVVMARSLITAKWRFHWIRITIIKISKMCPWSPLHLGWAVSNWVPSHHLNQWLTLDPQDTLIAIQLKNWYIAIISHPHRLAYILVAGHWIFMTKSTA